MSQIRKEDLKQAAILVHRSPRTIRRWAAQGVDIRDVTKLETFANQVSDRAFGRYGNGARLMGRKGGSKTSGAKKQSSKLNGRRGGRPKDGMFLLRRAIRNGKQLNTRKELDFKNASDDDLKAIWPVLVEIDQSYLFWVGDILNEIARRYGEASASGIIKHSPNPREFREAMMVSRAFSGRG
jgi:hypothetical protein